MAKRLLIRLVVGLATIWAACTLVFFGVESLPGDAAQAALGPHAPAQLVRDLRREFGLDQPLGHRYKEWLLGFVRGDLGRSLPSGQPVTGVIGDKVRNTAFLALATIVVLVPLGVALGILTAVRRDRWLDHGVAATTLALISTPEFVVGTFLAVALAVWVRWLPPVSQAMLIAIT